MTLREQQAKILEQLAKGQRGGTFDAAYIDAFKAGAAALRAPVRPQEKNDEDQARSGQPQPNSGADLRGDDRER